MGTECIICGIIRGPNHKCSAAAIARYDRQMAAQEKRIQDQALRRYGEGLTYSERLEDGVFLMGEG